MKTINHESGRALPVLLDEKAVAAMLSITQRHLRSLRAQRLVPFIRLGRLIRFDPSAVAEAVSKLEVKPRR
jgi:hypothetical protein